MVFLGVIMEKIEKIKKLNKEMADLDAEMTRLRTQGSFLSFFVKSLLIALAFVIVTRFFDLSNSGKILVFVLIFILANLVQAFIIKKTRKEKIEEIRFKQIKIQSEIFKLSKDK